MRKLSDKVDNNSTEKGELTAIEWDSEAKELENVVLHHEELDETKDNQLLEAILYISGKIDITTTVTVGTNGDYQTINEALEYLSKKRATYKNKGVVVEIKLLTGFVMQEQVHVNGIDLGWIVINGEDTETVIDRAFLTEVSYNTVLSTDEVTVNDANRYGAFFAQNNAVLPLINQKFNMNANGDAVNRVGIIVDRNSKAMIGKTKGFVNCGDMGALVTNSSSLYALEADFSGAGFIGLYAVGSCSVGARYAIANNCGYAGVVSSQGSRIDFDDGTANNNALYGLYAGYGATINAHGATITENQQYNVLASQQSFINVDQAELSNGGDCNIVATNNSVINAHGANAQNAGGLTAVQCYYASTVDATAINISNSAGYGVIASQLGLVAISNAIINNMTNNAIYSANGSHVTATYADISTSGTYAFYASTGSTIATYGSTGKIDSNLAVNTVSSGGIIFR